MPELEVHEGKNFKPLLQGHEGSVAHPRSSAVLPWHAAQESTPNYAGADSASNTVADPTGVQCSETRANWCENNGNQER